MEKYSAHPREEEFSLPRPSPRREFGAASLVKRLLLIVFVCAAVYLSFFRPSKIEKWVKHDWRYPCFGKTGADEPPQVTFSGSMDDVASPVNGQTTTAADGGNKVPFEAHIMSKCPDARDCLQKLVVPAMEKISDKVDFRLSFIGNASELSSSVSCMHGPKECVGNILILCAANLPFSGEDKTPVVRSLGFANCLISSYPHIPERSLVEGCALEHGIDFEALNTCASQQEDEDDWDRDRSNDRERGANSSGQPSGLALLRKSFKHSQSLGVKTSCTVRVDERIWCIRDGGEWKNCVQNGGDVSVLVDEVEKLYKERN